MATSTPEPAFDLKGMVLSATVLRLRTTDVTQIERELKMRTSQLPHFFDRAPVVIDCEILDGAELDLAALAGAMRSCNLVPVGVRNLPAAAAASAAAAGFGVLKVSSAPGSSPAQRLSPAADKPLHQQYPNSWK